MKYEKEINTLSEKLEINNPQWLYNLIQFESGFNPAVKNPFGSARGLIQFTNSTSKTLGYKDSLDLIQKNPSVESQLKKPVYNYLKKFMPFPTKQSLYMAVFYPKARNIKPDTFFPDNIINVNPNIYTVQDYIDKVDKIIRKKSKEYIEKVKAYKLRKLIPILLLSIAGLYFILKKGI